MTGPEMVKAAAIASCEDRLCICREGFGSRCIIRGKRSLLAIFDAIQEPPSPVVTDAFCDTLAEVQDKGLSAQEVSAAVWRKGIDALKRAIDPRNDIIAQ